MAVFTVVSIVLFTLIAAIHLESMPKRAPWDSIYWLHDHTFLWIKAFSYTLFYPKSWIWWSLIAIIGGAGLLSWLTDLSFIKKPHIFLLRQALRRPACHPFLLHGAKLFARLGGRPRLLKAVAENERDRSFLDLTLHPRREAPSTVCRRIASLIRFQLLLARIVPENPLAQWQALEQWSRALLHLHAKGPADRKWFRHLMFDLTSAARLNEPMAESLNGSRVAQGQFTRESIEADLSALASIGSEYWSGDRSAEKPDMVQLARLTDSCEARRRQVYEVSRRLEAALRSPPSLQTSMMADMPQVALSPSALPIAGRLIASIALHTAIWAEAPRLATAFLESMENLCLLATAAPNVAQATTGLAILVEGTPTSQLYRLIFEEMEERLRQETREWELELESSNGALAYSDFELVEKNIASLSLASGPSAQSRNAKRNTHES